MRYCSRVTVVSLLWFLVVPRMTQAQDPFQDVDENTKICQNYLSEADSSYARGGVDALTLTAFTLAVENPTGPYLWCYKNITKDVQGADIVRLLSPYLPANVTLSQSTTDRSPTRFLNKIEEVARTAVDSCCGDNNLFNFSLPFNQTRSMVGSMFFDSERDYIGMTEALPSDQGGTPTSYFFCGCSITGIDSSPRNNTYAEMYLAQNTASPTSGSMYLGQTTACLSIVIVSMMMMFMNP
jgi:hypothetical protein